MRSRRDFDEENLFDQAEYVRRKLDREESLLRGRERLQAEAVADAKLAEAGREFMREANRSAIIAEYQRAGVQPPKIDDDGNPTCSLSLLLRMGWWIEDIEGERKLVRPA